MASTTVANDGYPWYGVQLFGIKSSMIAEYLDRVGISYFIPMQNVVYVDQDGKRRHKLRPVVSNLLFIKKDKDDKVILDSMEPYHGSFYIFRKKNSTRDLYEIAAEEMQEFIIMCNPELTEKKYIDENEAKLKPGAKVLVHHGPLKGLTGRLVRQSGKYYLLKEVPGMAVMLKVTKWCCKEC